MHEVNDKITVESSIVKRGRPQLILEGGSSKTSRFVAEYEAPDIT